jgi:NDP-sugar pyrophosphorylase family protein
MAEVAGKPFLDWVARYLRQQGIRRIVFSTGYLAEKIQDYFEKHAIPGMEFFFARETEPQGTAGGFLNAVETSKLSVAAWIVLNGDSLALTDLAGPAAALRSTENQGVLIGVKVNDSTRYGTLALGQSGELLGFREKQPGSGVISAGMYVLKNELLSRFAGRRPLSFETDVFPALINDKQKLAVIAAEAPFLDIGTPETLKQAADFVRHNQQWFGSLHE